jgi:hypothetical protein
MQFTMKWQLLTCSVLAIALSAPAQKPVIFGVSDVVVGAQRIPTTYLFAVGKWSDAGDHVGGSSTNIQCYKALGFCDVANAHSFDGEASVDLDAFDILRWDRQEIIAVDSSAICIVSTIRVDLRTKRITLSSSDKGVTKDPFCKGSDNLPTAVLWGEEDVVKEMIGRAKAKKSNQDK